MTKRPATPTRKREMEKDLAVLVDQLRARVRLFRQRSKTFARDAKKAIDSGQPIDVVHHSLVLRDNYDAASYELETIQDELQELLEHHKDR